MQKLVSFSYQLIFMGDNTIELVLQLAKCVLKLTRNETDFSHKPYVLFGEST